MYAARRISCTVLANEPIRHASPGSAIFSAVRTSSGAGRGELPRTAIRGTPISPSRRAPTTVPAPRPGPLRRPARPSVFSDRMPGFMPKWWNLVDTLS